MGRRSAFGSRASLHPLALAPKEDERKYTSVSTVGGVDGLLRYPVKKSTGGEDLEEASVNFRGIYGHRYFERRRERCYRD